MKAKKSISMVVHRRRWILSGFLKCVGVVVALSENEQERHELFFHIQANLSLN